MTTANSYKKIIQKRRNCIKILPNKDMPKQRMRTVGVLSSAKALNRTFLRRFGGSEEPQNRAICARSIILLCVTRKVTEFL